METSKPDLKSIVAKDNQLIGHMAKYDLSELRLIAYCLAHYDSRKPNNRTIQARVSDLQNIFKMSSKDAYGVVKQAVRSVNRKPLEIENDNKDEEWYIFTGFAYYKQEGRFEFKISPEAQPFLMELRGNFTRYRLGDVYKFKAASTWKLYELLKRWLDKRKWEVYLEDFRFLMGIGGKYPRWSNLNQWILQPSTEEINKVSDLQVSYKKIKSGRRVIGIFFRINPKEGQNIIDLDTETELLKVELIGVGVHKKTAENYTILAQKKGKTKDVLSQLPEIIKRAKNKIADVPMPKYVIGSIQKLLNEGNFFEDEKEKEKKNKESLDFLKSLPEEDLKILANAGNIAALKLLKTNI